MRYLLLMLLGSQLCFGQSKTSTPIGKPDRPKLVVGIVVDQMRWDYLYQYYDRYASNGGFKRFLSQGFSCENTFIDYLPTVTAAGHTCIFTGSVPSVHGIVGNDWWERDLGKGLYCTQDDSAVEVGGTGNAGKMSPKNLQVTTICDQLKLATNFRSKVVGVAIKDRGSILPSGHAANAAYWFEPSSGNFITSDYYMNQLPAWVNAFNDRKIVNQFLTQGWNTLYPINTYVQSTPDEKNYEGKPFGRDAKGFPYNLSKFVGKSYGTISQTPFGNTMTKEMAMAAVNGEQMGKDSIADFLTVSFSATDYVGHSFGPNSIEAEDTYLRLDKDLGEFFRFLDEKVGKGQYLVFLSADHGASNSVGFMKENKLPGWHSNFSIVEKDMDSLMKIKFGASNIIISSANEQLYLDHRLIDSLKLDAGAIKQWIIEYVGRQEGVDRALDMSTVMTAPINSKLRERIANSYYPSRTGDIMVILKSHWVGGGSPNGATHGSWYPYDAHIPLLWYGWKIKPGKMTRETHMTDIAATVAALLKIQMPSGCVGTVIQEVTNY